MDDPVAHICRATANRLAGAYGSRLTHNLEDALYNRTGLPERLVDPIAIAAYVVAIAELAWGVYGELKRTTAKPSPEEVAVAVRGRMEETHPVNEETGEIIDVIVIETVNHANTLRWWHQRRA